MGCVVGLADHHGWTVVVVVGGGGTVVDRRRAPLIAPGLPANPVHHECQTLDIGEATALVEKVERSVTAHVEDLWAQVGADHDVAAVAIREIPPLPEALIDRIRSYHAQTRADSAMYRRILVEGATARGWGVEHYDHRYVENQATTQLGLAPDHLAAPRRTLGPPWAADHRRAYAAALLARSHLPT
jgi:hypothetical protein